MKLTQALPNLPARYQPISETTKAVRAALGESEGVRFVLGEAALEGDSRWGPLGRMREDILNGKPFTDGEYRAAVRLLQAITNKYDSMELPPDLREKTEKAKEELGRVISELERDMKNPDQKVIETAGSRLAWFMQAVQDGFKENSLQA